MHSNKRSIFLTAAALGMMAGTLPGGGTVVGTAEAVAKTQAQVESQQPTKDRAPATRSGTDAVAPSNWGSLRRTGWRYGRPGWSVAEDRRRAKKARNVARNRRAQRGGK